MAPRPLNDGVWLLFPEGERIEGGIVLPEREASRMDAVVVAKGPKASGDFGVGDTVIANLYDGVPVNHEGVQYRCVPSSKILGVLE